MSEQEISEILEIQEIQESEIDKNLESGEEEESQDSPKQSPTSAFLRLGDIIQIIAPKNPDLHENSFFIEYIDSKYISLINVATLHKYPLNINSESEFTDESITEIDILSRAEEDGYARQNGLVPGTWVELHIAATVRVTITGEITDLNEDQIQITTYPDLKVIYVNFDYKGIPKHIPFEKIVVREKPAELEKIASLKDIRGLDSDTVEEMKAREEDISIEYLDSGEAVLRGTESAKPDSDYRDRLHDLYRSSQGIVVLEDLEDIVQLVELPEHLQRYSVDIQVNSIVDEMLSTIPNPKRTKSVLDRIHLLVERYKELRKQFSKFDENDTIRSFKMKDPTYKPLVERFVNLDTRLRWILPVVTVNKKLYDIESGDSDDTLATGEILDEDEQLKRTVYYDNKSGEANRYLSLNQSQADSVRPFYPLGDSPDQLVNQKVKTDLEAIIQNTEDFYSTTVHQANTMMRRFVIESYNLGLSTLETGYDNDENNTTNATWRRCTEGGKRVSTRVEMTPADKIPIKSLVVLPKQVMQYSRLYLPSTNILDRTNLHQAEFVLFRLLRKTLKNTDLIQHIVDDFEKPIDYEVLEKETGQGFLSKPTEYVLEDSLENQPNKFYRFLSTIFPKTDVLIRFIQKQITGKLSVATVMAALEPFLVYSDDITYGHYAKQIRYFIKTRIAELKQQLIEKVLPFKTYKDHRFDIKEESKPILRILKDKPELFDRFLSLYGIKDAGDKNDKKTSNEITNFLLEYDQNVLFSTLLSTMMISLRTPEGLSVLNDRKKTDELESMDDIERIRPSDCSKKVITKQYDSMESLMKDNHSDEVFYDAEYDSTPYSILKKYEDQQKKMSPDKFLAFLEENLVQKHECPREMAPALAATIIEKKKKVGNGEYAVVIITPKLPDKSADSKSTNEDEIEEEARKKTLYFQRKKNVWIQDKDIDETMFIDSAVILCNMAKKCSIKQTKVGDECDSIKDTKERLMEIDKKKAMKEFERRYQISVDDLRSRLEKELAERVRFIQRLAILKDLHKQKANYLEYEYGKGLQLEEIIHSPYEPLLNMILEQDDFTKKQIDIVRFAAKFTREPIRGFHEDSVESEDGYWLYCKESNVKLLPDFLVILAQEFCNGGDYNKKLDELCTPDRVAVVGNRIIDIHSGRTIRLLDFSTEEGYNDAGFRISTNAVLEVKNLENLAALAVLDEAELREFKNETAEMIYNISSAICKHIDIPIKAIYESVIRISMDLIQDKQVVSSEESYSKRAAKQEKKQGKGLQPYDQYRDEMILIITTSVLIACIQSIQGLKTMKTFPGCIRSFTGYPFGGIEDLSTLDYFSCVLEKMRNPTIKPWNTIFRLNRQNIKDRLKTICELAVLKNGDVLDLFLKKRDYLVLYPEIDFIPLSLQLGTWKQFLPPIGKIDIAKHLQPVAQTFQNDFLQLLHSGNKAQTEDFLVLKSKVIQHTYGILQKIQDVVDSKTVLLKTMSNIPFLQNACCNESGASMHPLQYFIAEDPEIANYMKSMKSIIKSIDYVNKISKAELMFDPRRTGVRIVNQDNIEYDQENIYAAFIHYCRLDKSGFIPTEFHPFFTEIPDGYNKRASLPEKIVLLKQQGKQLTNSDLNSLMTIIRKKNIIEKYKVPRYTFVGILRDIIENFDRTDSTVIEEPLRRHLGNCLEDYSPTRLRAIEKENPQKVLEDLKNYLADTNERMYVEIVNFIRDYGKPKEKKMRNILDFLNTTRTDCTDNTRKFGLQSWKLDCEMEQTGTFYDNGLYTIFHFIKQSIHQMTHVLPEIILNDVNYSEVPKHWELGDNDTLFLFKKIEANLASLKEFKQDPVITRVLQEIRLRNIDLYLFLSNLPVHTPIVKDGITYYSIFDKRAILQIILYVFYSVLHEYIMLSNDEDMLRFDRTDTLLNRRNKRRDILDSEGGLFSEDTFEADTDIYEKEGRIDAYDEMMEVQIEFGRKEELKTRVANLLMTYIDIIERNKIMVDYSYEDIASDIRSSKIKEKNMIIERLKRLTPEERRVENMMKVYKLGKWNVGQQRGLFEYDIATQERERQDLIEQGVQDNEELYNLAISELNTDIGTDSVDIQQLRRDADAEGEIDTHNEFYDFGNLREGYDDGYDPDGYVEEEDFADT